MAPPAAAGVFGFGIVTVGNAILVGGAILLVVGISVLWTVQRPEKITFVVGVGLLVEGTVAAAFAPTAVAAAIALGGLLIVLASTVPLLRESPSPS